MAKQQQKQWKPEVQDEPKAAEKSPDPVTKPVMVGEVELGACYEVLEGRVLLFLHTDTPTVWAKSGMVVCAESESLARMIDKQFAKVNKVENYEADKLVKITREDVLALMAGRRFLPVDAAKVSVPKTSTVPDVD